jgi:predicted dehydrogenase
VYFFEAAKHIHEANFRLLKEKLKEIGKIEGANLTFMKYSSRYQQVLAGEEPNIFSLKFSGGALVDLGVYLVYAAVELFGIPKETFYYHQKVATRVDGIGTIIFRYPYFDVIMQTGKIADSLLPCEIYGSKSTLIFDSIHDISSIELYHRNSNQKEQFANVRPEYDMMEEANDFAEMIERMDEMYYRTKYQHYMELSVHVNKIITELREKSGILFEVDNK